jgi:hypothetical protein
MSFEYLASPYSHPDPEVKADRFVEACRVAGELMKAGRLIFSPIAHSHPIEQYFVDGKAEGHVFWLEQDFALLRHAAKLLVLRLPGWEQSKGVKAEIDAAEAIGIPVHYLDP